MVESDSNDVVQGGGSKQKRPFLQSRLLAMILLPVCAVVWAKGVQTRNEAEHRRAQTEVDKPAHHFHKNKDGKKVYLAARYLKWGNGYAWTVWLPEDGRQYQLCLTNTAQPDADPDETVDLKSGSNIVELTQDKLTDCTAFCVILNGAEAAVMRKPDSWVQRGMRTEKLHAEDVYDPATLDETLLRLTPTDRAEAENTGVALWVRVKN